MIRNLCNRALRILGCQIKRVRKLLDRRLLDRRLYKSAKKLIIQINISQSIIREARMVGQNDALRIAVNSVAAQFLLDHELAYTVSPHPAPKPPWIIKNNFLIVEYRKLPKIVRVTRELCETFCRTSGIASISRRIKDSNPDIPF